MEAEAVGNEAHRAGAQHEVARHVGASPEFSGKRKHRAFGADDEPAEYACAWRVLGNLLQFRLAVEHEKVDPRLVCAAYGRGFLDRVAEADPVRRGAGFEAHGDFFPARRVETAAEGDQPLQDRPRRIGFHGVIDLRAGEGLAHGGVILLHNVEIEHQAWRRRLMVSQISLDLRCHGGGPL